MSVQSEAERAARRVTGLITSPRLNGYDPLSAVPTDRIDSLSSGEKALRRIGLAIDGLGVELGRVDDRCREEVGLALATFGMYVATGAEITG